MSDAWIAVIGGIITGIFSLIGVYRVNSKTTAVYTYRVDELEKSIKKLEDKQDRHNGWVERLIKLEGRVTEAEHDIRDLKAK